MALDLLTGIDGNVILPLIIAFHVSYFYRVWVCDCICIEMGFLD